MQKDKELIKTIDGVIEQTQAFTALTEELTSFSKNLETCFNELKNTIEGKETTKKEEKKAEKISYTKEDVRATLSEKSAEGFSKEVRALLLKFGADKLSTLSSDYYEAIIKEAKEIGND